MLLFYFSAFALLSLFIAAGVVVGGRGGKKDYSLGGRKAGAAGVTGILLGALVGGASTVGTVQMAYGYGMTAWWFTLGGGIGCLMLGLRFASPLRASEITTVADYLEKSYGDRGKAIALAATVSSSLGTFISVCAQFLSCIALIRGVVPIPAWLAALVAALSIWGFIASGGKNNHPLHRARNMRRCRRLPQRRGPVRRFVISAVVQRIRARFRPRGRMPGVDDRRRLHDADIPSINSGGKRHTQRARRSLHFGAADAADGASRLLDRANDARVRRRRISR